MNASRWLAVALFAFGCSTATTEPEGKNDGDNGKSDQIGDLEVCTFDEPWLFDTTADLTSFVVSETTYDVSDADDIPSVDRSQIIDAFLQDRNVVDSAKSALELADDETIDVIELKLEDGTDLDWVRYFSGDTEVGVIYAANTLVAQAVVSDGDFKKCESDEVESLVVDCSFGTWFFESSEDLESLPNSEVTIDIDSQTTELIANQIFSAAIQLEMLTGSEDYDEVFETSDEGDFELSKIEADGRTFDWVKFFAGDTEIGVIFDEGTTDIVAEIGDGDVLGCEKADKDPDPDPIAEFTCSFADAWEFDGTGSLDDFTVDIEPLTVDATNIDDQQVLTSQQIFQAVRHLELIDENAEFGEVFEASDDAEFILKTFETTTEGEVTWIQFFAGDTEIGVIYKVDTTEIVAEISDGDILSCVATQP